MKLICIFVMLIGCIMNQKENINAPKVDSIIPKGVTDKQFTGGALFYNEMDKELWKEITGFPKYFISNYGNIYSTKGAKNSFRNKSIRITSRYKYTQLWFNGRGYSKRISRLVAQEFIANPENKPEVNHEDCNKMNNYYKNLQWCTKRENEDHAIVNKLHPSGEKVGGHKLTEKQVTHIRYIYNRYHPMGLINQRQLAKEYGVCQSTIGYILRNQTWKNISL